MGLLNPAVELGVNVGYLGFVVVDAADGSDGLRQIPFLYLRRPDAHVLFHSGINLHRGAESFFCPARRNAHGCKIHAADGAVSRSLLNHVRVHAAGIELYLRLLIPAGGIFTTTAATANRQRGDGRECYNQNRMLHHLLLLKSDQSGNLQQLCSRYFSLCRGLFKIETDIDHHPLTVQ